MMDDAKDSFFEVSSKLAALQQIIYRHRETPTSLVEERLEGLAEWVTPSFEAVGFFF
jgi:hypothetical protein